MEVSRRVSRSAHVVVKKVGHGEVNVVDDHQLVHLASLVEEIELEKEGI